MQGAQGSLDRWMEATDVHPSERFGRANGGTPGGHSQRPSRGAEAPETPNSAEHYKREIVRVHGLWREAKDEVRVLKSKQTELMSVHAHRGAPGSPEFQNVEVTDRLRFNELQLDRERGRSRLLQTNMEESKMALALCEAEIDKQAAERRCISFLSHSPSGGLIPSHSPYNHHAIIKSRVILRLR